MRKVEGEEDECSEMLNLMMIEFQHCAPTLYSHLILRVRDFCQNLTFIQIY